MSKRLAVRGGTLWRRSGILAIPALLVIGVMALALFFGFMPLRLSIAGQEFKLTSNGGGASAPKGISIQVADMEMKDGTHRPIFRAGVPEAELPKGLCLSFRVTFPVVGSNIIRLRTVKDTVGKDITLAAADAGISGVSALPWTKDGKVFDGNKDNIDEPAIINKDASDLRYLQGPVGALGVDAGPGSHAGELKATAVGARVAGTATLKLPRIAFGHGEGAEDGECY